MGRTTSPRSSETSVTLRTKECRRKGDGVLIDSMVFIDTSEEKRSSTCLPVTLEEVCMSLTGVGAKLSKQSSESPSPQTASPVLPCRTSTSRNTFVPAPRKLTPLSKCASDSEIQQTVKCALVGDSAVGKTSMLLSYTADSFPETHQPTMYDKFTTTIVMSGKRLPVTICDTAGKDDFAHLRPLCYPQVDVVLICFSVVDKKSFDNIKSKWLQELKRQCPTKPYVLVGTQVDKRADPIVLQQLKKIKQKPISKQDGQKLAHQCRAASYIECSALTQLNLKETFDEGIIAALDLHSDYIDGRTIQCNGAACNIL